MVIFHYIVDFRVLMLKHNLELQKKRMLVIKSAEKFLSHTDVPKEGIVVTK